MTNVNEHQTSESQNISAKDLGVLAVESQWLCRIGKQGGLPVRKLYKGAQPCAALQQPLSEHADEPFKGSDIGQIIPVGEGQVKVGPSHKTNLVQSCRNLSCSSTNFYEFKAQLRKLGRRKMRAYCPQGCRAAILSLGVSSLLVTIKPPNLSGVLRDPSSCHCTLLQRSIGGIDLLLNWS